jgi:hypothetical protein
MMVLYNFRGPFCIILQGMEETSAAKNRKGITAENTLLLN